jgi:DNA-directed RNA polymerase subunit RPC12/RpoP
MDHGDYYTDLKFCAKCGKYVPYLMGVEHSYCTECGGRVRLFSQQDGTRSRRTSRASARRAGDRARNSAGANRLTAERLLDSFPRT